VATADSAGRSVNEDSAEAAIDHEELAARTNAVTVLALLLENRLGTATTEAR
jgi:hypothetical protein